MSLVGQERRFHDVRHESALPSTPERLPRRNEPTLRADIVAKVGFDVALIGAAGF
jgi:hypothetical protein